MERHSVQIHMSAATCLSSESYEVELPILSFCSDVLILGQGVSFLKGNSGRGEGGKSWLHPRHLGIRDLFGKVDKRSVLCFTCGEKGTSGSISKS